MLKRPHRLMNAASGIWAITLLSFSAVAAPAVKEVQFAPGTSSAKVSGIVAGKNDVCYRLSAKEGQTIKVTAKTERKTTYFNVTPPGSGEDIFIGSSLGSEFEGKLPATGAYTITVYQMGAAASENKTSKYDLEISITGGGAAPATAPAVPATPAASPKPAAKEVKFAPGASSAKINGTIAGKNDVLYTVSAKEGQTMKVSATTQRKTTYFNVTPPNSEEALFIGSILGSPFEGKLPATGAYTITVYQMGAAASENKTSKYDLEISITGG